ncbi:MAG: hypothetical protein PHU46_14620 [Rhodocyclaceae bacterium]|nr:hypothetical protein [Rhodocyclaceae bacterium]
MAMMNFSNWRRIYLAVSVAILMVTTYQGYQRARQESQDDQRFVQTLREQWSRPECAAIIAGAWQAAWGESAHVGPCGELILYRQLADKRPLTSIRAIEDEFRARSQVRTGDEIIVGFLNGFVMTVAGYVLLLVAFKLGSRVRQHSARK